MRKVDDMADLMDAETGGLRDVAQALDPADIMAAKEAATRAKASTALCGDPMPGCRQFSLAAAQVADDIITFCTAVEAGVPAYAAMIQAGADNYDAGETNAVKEMR